ncbi:MAG TPA: hypothetical protein VIJ73_22300, partial [Methylomirabilota bacterium]
MFISYSKTFESQTREPASGLRAKCLAVWYDTSLIPGDSFRDVIMSDSRKPLRAKSSCDIGSPLPTIRFLPGRMPWRN